MINKKIQFIFCFGLLFLFLNGNCKRKPKTDTNSSINLHAPGGGVPGGVPGGDNGPTGATGGSPAPGGGGGALGISNNPGSSASEGVSQEEKVKVAISHIDSLVAEMQQDIDERSTKGINISEEQLNTEQEMISLLSQLKKALESGEKSQKVQEVADFFYKRFFKYQEITLDVPKNQDDAYKTLQSQINGLIKLSEFYDQVNKLYSSPHLKRYFEIQEKELPVMKINLENLLNAANQANTTSESDNKARSESKLTSNNLSNSNGGSSIQKIPLNQADALIQPSVSEKSPFNGKRNSNSKSGQSSANSLIPLHPHPKGSK